jgi:hypothetical protein
MGDFLDQKLREIQTRLEELKPQVEEYERLLAAEKALAGVGTGAARPAAAAAAKARRSTRTTSTRAKKSGASTSSTGRRGRPKGSGQRAQQALELVRAKPGITIPEMAESMGIKQNYLYRVVPDLAKDGQLTKSGRGWHVREPV